MSSSQKQTIMHVDQVAEDSRAEEEEGGDDAESGTSGAPGRGYNDIDTWTEESKSTEQTSQPGKAGAKVIMVLFSIPECLFQKHPFYSRNPDSAAPGESKHAFLHCGDVLYHV